MYCVVVSDGSCLYGIVNFFYYCLIWVVQDVCYLEDFYVLFDVCGQQIGKQLIEYVCWQVEECCCVWFYWYIQESNYRVQCLYDWVVDKLGVIEYCIEF